MSKRSNQKRITVEGRTLKFLREQAKLSVRAAAAASGVGDGVINHLENGRIRVHSRHLEHLLPAYGSSAQTYEMFASGAVPIPLDKRSECIELIRQMSETQVLTVLPVLISIASRN